MNTRKRNQSTPLNRCPNCRITVVSWGFHWICDDYHPEIIAYMKAKKQDKEDEFYSHSYDPAE